MLVVAYGQSLSVNLALPYQFSLPIAGDDPSTTPSDGRWSLRPDTNFNSIPHEMPARGVV
jgi:hypothetical protein